MEEKSLYEILCLPDFLYDSWLGIQSKKGSSGVDGQTIWQFEKDLGGNLLRLSQELEEERYDPSPLRGVKIPKEKPGDFRNIGIPTVRDRIVFRAVNTLLQEIWDHQFSPLSFGYRPGKGVRQAIKAVTRQTKKGKTWFVRGDIQGCFDSFDWDILTTIIDHAMPDPQLLQLLNKAVRVPVVEQGRIRSRSCGVPQGSSVSPILANLYLHIFDSTMNRWGYNIIRYGDDWIALIGNGESALECFYRAVDALEDLHISISPEKSGIGDLQHVAVDFLGFQIDAWGAEAGPKAWKWLSKAVEQYTTSENPLKREKARGELMNICQLYRRSSDIGSIADKVVRSPW
nr:reverse transcriptase domain-containing protein [uncultured Dethiosulfovibrio sp.]